MERCYTLGTIVAYLNKITEYNISASFINNTFTNTNYNDRGIGTGFTLISGLPVLFKNNILYAHPQQNMALYLMGNSDLFDIRYNLFYGYNGIINAGYELDSTNLLTDPLLVSNDPIDPRLSPDSPCIDAGDPNSPLDPDGTRADIGAFYYHQEQHIKDIRRVYLNGFELIDVYPNPFNSAFSVIFSNEYPLLVKAGLFDTQGRIAYEHPEQWYATGTHHLSIAPPELPNGTYLLTIQSEAGVKVIPVVNVK